MEASLSGRRISKMTATKAYSTSQKSPHYTCVNSRRTPSSTYQHMFLEDFCDGFSFELAQDKDDRLFYDVTPEGTQLKKLLTFQKYDFLRYDMDRLFSHIMRRKTNSCRSSKFVRFWTN